MAASWNVLVVDDEEDVHGVTTLALKRKKWRERPIALRSARSGKEAREIISAKDAPQFHCALVDVVMETDDAGLQLCDFIRKTMPRTMRIVLRTGQPGAAPPEKVLNDYDIDYYLAKTEVTEDRLYAALRACFRSSLDISALLGVGAQLRGLTTALQDPTTNRDRLAAIMLASLKLLEEKYSAHIIFVHDARHPAIALPNLDPASVGAAITSAYKEGLAPLQLHPGTAVGLDKATYLVVPMRLNPLSRVEKSLGERMKSWLTSIVSENAGVEPEVGVVVQFDHELLPRTLHEFNQDLELFLSNWTVADSSFRLRDALVRNRIEMLKQLGDS